MKDPLHRLYQTKLTLLATLLAVAGVALLLLAHRSVGLPHWLAVLPLADFGSALFTTGLIVVAFEYLDRRDADERTSGRLRQVLADEAPAIRDAVIEGFAFAPRHLAAVASPETLDRIVRNCLAIQLGDQQLAADLYADLRTQVQRAAERRTNLRIAVTLTPWDEGLATGSGAMFVATVRKEYRVRLGQPTLRFSCVSDPVQYREVLHDPSSTEVWHFPPAAGLDAGSPGVFDLVQFTANGQPQASRRSIRAGGRVFTVNVKHVEPGAETLIAYTYRVLLEQHSHVLYLDIGQPTKGVQVDFAYAGCGIRHVNVLDFIAGAEPTRVSRSPAAVPTPSVSVGFDGWVLPKSGVAFSWVLDAELKAGRKTPAARYPGQRSETGA